MPVSGFMLMRLAFMIRDFISPRMNVVREAGIRPGNSVLDFGCGPGSYILPVAALVGRTGTIFAQDIHPLAIKAVQEIARKNGLENVTAIQSDCATGLPDRTVDVVLLYDTYHHLKDPDSVLKEMHRVLKPEGILSFSDHHMKQKEIEKDIAARALFTIRKKNKKTYTLSKRR